MLRSLTIHYFEFLVVLVLSHFLNMNAPNLIHDPDFVVLSVMVSLKKVIVAMIPQPSVFVFLVMWSFGNIRCLRVFLLFRTPLSVMLMFLLTHLLL
jgi:hypothetical protein